MGPTAAVLARGNANDAHVESSQGKTSGQVKRAEAGKATKAKRNGWGAGRRLAVLSLHIQLG